MHLGDDRPFADGHHYADMSQYYIFANVGEITVISRITKEPGDPESDTPIHLLATQSKPEIYGFRKDPWELALDRAIVDSMPFVLEHGLKPDGVYV